MASKTLGDISAFITKGATPTTYGYKWQSLGVPFLRSECVSSRGLDMRQSMFISESADHALRRSRVEDGDILMTITGNVGRVVRLSGVGGANINQHIARVRIRDSAFDPGFIYHFLSQDAMREHFESIVTGQAYPQISLAQVRATTVPEVSLVDQKAIAATLDSADALIASLERLIAKKRAIKQGMFQELLAGKARLPGFTGPRLDYRLGEIARVKTGARNNQDKVVAGEYPFFVRSATVERIDSYSHDCEAILVPGEGGIGSIFHYIDGKFEVHQRVYMISGFATAVSGRYAYHFMRQFFGAHAMENSVKATVDSLRLPTFKNFCLQLPPRDEQDAIVRVLDDAETEIEILARRLAKSREVKLGMMQQLLAGRVHTSAELTV